MRQREELFRGAFAHTNVAMVLADVVMPRMGGREAAERLAAARPGLKVLYHFFSPLPGIRWSSSVPAGRLPAPQFGALR